jgi:hypothetical protein
MKPSNTPPAFTTEAVPPDSFVTDQQPDPVKADTAIQRVFHWKNIELAPYSPEARLIWFNLQEDGDHSVFAATILVWLLINIRRAYLASKLTGDQRWEEAASWARKAARNKEASRLLCYRFGGSMKFKEQGECVNLAGEIVEDASSSELAFEEGLQQKKEGGSDEGK